MLMKYDAIRKFVKNLENPSFRKQEPTLIDRVKNMMKKIKDHQSNILKSGDILDKLPGMKDIDEDLD